MSKVSEQVWEERREVLVRWRESGLSAAAFCRREGIPYWKFGAWKKRLADEREGGAGSAERPEKCFAEVVVKGDAAGLKKDTQQARNTDQVLHAEIVMPGGAVVRLYNGADMELIRAAMEALSRC